MSQTFKDQKFLKLQLLYVLCPIPHICPFFYTGRIFESQYFTPKNYEKHPKITTNCPKKSKICSFSRSVWKILHRTEFVSTGTACGACDKYEVCPKACPLSIFVQEHLYIQLWCDSDDRLKGTSSIVHQLPISQVVECE